LQSIKRNCLMNAKCFWQNNFFVTGFCNAIAQTIATTYTACYKKLKKYFFSSC